jgi:hypothetical protein
MPKILRLLTARWIKLHTILYKVGDSDYYNDCKLRIYNNWIWSVNQMFKPMQNNHNWIWRYQTCWLLIRVYTFALIDNQKELITDENMLHDA